ncbi:MAG: hypothetical protein ACRYG2_34865, partial [Janthinobacterium lividum]
MTASLGSVGGVVAETLGAGNRRVGAAVLVVLAVAAVLLPVVLALVLSPGDGTAAGGVLGVLLGVITDLLAVVLLLGVVTHRTTGRRLRALSRSVHQLGGRDAKLEASLAKQGELLKRQPGETARARTAVERSVRDLGNRVQATQNLFALVPPRGPVPPMMGYVASPDVLLVLVQQLLTIRPGLAIECGSGTSTLFLALAAQQHGLDCRIVSLENNAEYAGYTRQLLQDHGVAHLAEVRHAPLTPTGLTDHAGPWYDPAAYEDLHDIGL